MNVEAALLGARRVVLTDLPIALPTLRRNIAANLEGVASAEDAVDPSAEVAVLDWGATDDPPLLHPCGGAFERQGASSSLGDQ